MAYKPKAMGAGGLCTVGAQPLSRQRRIDPIAQGNALGHLSPEISQP